MIQHKTREKQPEKSGWYDTDKGNLYWFAGDFEWSCRNNRISNEYPKYWYEDK